MKIEVVGDQAVWLPTDVSEADAERLLVDPNYCIQDKEDGIHVLAARTERGVSTRNRKGEPHSVPQGLTQVLMGLPVGSMLDGERLHEGGYVVFDILYWDGRDWREESYANRLGEVYRVCSVMQSTWIRPIASAFSENAKRDFLLDRREQMKEGVIFKDMRAPYRPGRPVEGGTLRRLKFTKRMSVILFRRQGDTKASFDMLAFDGKPLPSLIGTVSAQQFFTDLLPGQARVGEVEYLYGTPNRKLVQPRLVRPNPWREDKSFEECTLDQVIVGGRFASNGSDRR